MTILNVMDGLVERLEESLKNFPLKVPENDQVPFKIFRHKVPERLIKKNDYSQKDAEKELYPFVVIKIDRGKKSANVSNQDNIFNLIIGIRNDGKDGEGYDDVVTCIQKVWDDLNENPIIANFHRLKYEAEWAVSDDDEKHPHYYGVVQLTIESPSMQFTGGYESGERTY